MSVENFELPTTAPALETNHALVPRRDSRAFCMAPWVHLAVAIGGVAKPCCEAKGQFGDVRQQSLQDIWHGQAFREFRAKMLEDQRDDRCRKCYDVEKTGGSSLRSDFNKRFGHHAARLGAGFDGADPLAPPLPVSLDIRFSNLCNFSCRMCFHGSSSKWFSDARKLGWTVAPDALIATFSSTDQGMQALRPLLGSVEDIYWAGGEPLLLEQHYAILNELIDQGRTNVTLRYNSNMSELRLGRLDVLPLWSRFKNVTLEASIDGTGQRGELIREGMSWTDFVANVTAVKQNCPHVRLRFGITVSVFNVWALPELHRDLLVLGCGGEDDFWLHVLQEPDFYSIRILPRRLKHEIARRLQAYADIWRNDAKGRDANSIERQFRHIIDHMMDEDRTDLIDSFRSATWQLDKLRNKSTAEICPELRPMLRPPALSGLRRLVRGARRCVVRLKRWLAPV